MIPEPPRWSRPCPLCQKILPSTNEIQVHLALHLQRIAIFSLPRSTSLGEYEEEDDSSEDIASQIRSQDVGPNTTERKPQTRSQSESTASSGAAPRRTGRDSSESMLKAALASAKSAVLRDNAQDVKGAMAAYSRTCEQLHAMLILSDQGDMQKLLRIIGTYSVRVRDLEGVAASHARSMKSEADFDSILAAEDSHEIEVMESLDDFPAPPFSLLNDFKQQGDFYKEVEGQSLDPNGVRERLDDIHLTSRHQALSTDAENEVDDHPPGHLSQNQYANITIADQATVQLGDVVYHHYSHTGSNVNPETDVDFYKDTTLRLSRETGELLLKMHDKLSPDVAASFSQIIKESEQMAEDVERQRGMSRGETNPSIRADNRDLLMEELKIKMQKLERCQQAMRNVYGTMHENAMNPTRNIKA